MDGGAALYTLPSKDTLKFNITFVFPNTLFTMPQANITTLNAMTDMLILGGSGNKTYEQMQKELSQNGIALSTAVNEMGAFVLTCEALTEDFERVLTIISDVILKPRFDVQALLLWKQQAKSDFIGLSNVNTLRKQMLFIGTKSAALAFGNTHYLATAIKRTSPAYTQIVTLKDIQNMYQHILNRNGLNVMLTGAYPSTGQTSLTNIISKIPAKESAILAWLPERLQPQTSHASFFDQKTDSKKMGFVKTAIIQKNDMTQSQISLRFYFPTMGDLNPIEKAQMAILTEIFSATGGVVGNDRFSKAMRADSGLSYSPHAYFNPDVILPNTNLSVFIMNFQSPNEKVFDAVMLAKNTWDTFVTKGISAHELDKTRSALMNSMLAHELTVFDKAAMFFGKINRGKVPSVNPIQESLEALDAQRNHDKLNIFLKNTFERQNLGTLVIMGKPSQDQIEKLKANSDLDFVETKEVNSLL